MESMERLVVDGYNVIHAWDDLKARVAHSLEDARDALVSRLGVYHLVTGSEVTVVFDAHRVPGGRDRRTRVEGVHVVFTRAGRTADTVIERLAYQARRDSDPLLVATSDGFQRDLVRAMGGAVIDARELERRVVSAEAELARQVGRYER